MSKWLVPKAILAVLLVAGYALAQRILYPILTNPVAVKQVEDSATSYVGIATLESLWFYGWFLVLAVVAMLFVTDVIRLFTRRGRDNDQRMLGE